uniref:Uncharacterized protein n=1 Tax=Oryza meridionalis TaxID=40149 RepID=A0A0E0DLD9_9ORYZ
MSLCARVPPVSPSRVRAMRAFPCNHPTTTTTSLQTQKEQLTAPRVEILCCNAHTVGVTDTCSTADDLPCTSPFSSLPLPPPLRLARVPPPPHHFSL